MLYLPSPDPETIKATRIKHGLATYQAANLLNITPSVWSNYERGEQAMPPFNWSLFLNALGETPAINLKHPLAELANRAISFVPPPNNRSKKGYQAPSPETLKMARVQHNLKSKDCCELLGISEKSSSQQWGRYERGTTVIPERSWVIFQVATGMADPPPYSDFETALLKKPSYKKPPYIPPTPAELRELLKKYDLTVAEAAKVVAVNPRQFRRYISETEKQATTIPERLWLILKSSVQEESALAENPESSGFDLVHTGIDSKTVQNEILIQADKLKKYNRKRKLDLLPQFALEFVLKPGKTETDMLLFFRFPLYEEGYWSMWQGYQLAHQAAHAILKAVSERTGFVQVKFS